jgi:hypothetical protein
MSTKIGNIRGAGTVTGTSPLHSSGQAIKFAVYWPRQSPYPEWWSQLHDGVVTWTQVGNELDQIKAALGVNTIRVLTYYDHQYRDSAGAVTGWTDGAGNHNPVYLGYLSTFADMCAERGLDLIVTMYQLLPALHDSDDWSFLEADILHYESFHRFMLGMLATKSNVKLYNLINEPDGYGVWANTPLAGRVLTFLSRLKAVGKTTAPNLACLINTSTHDNNFRRFPGAPPGSTSVYELSDILALNTFLWADTGFWPGQCYRTQYDYINTQNILKKPVMQTECGFPANYAQQGVSGAPIVNESGTATGGTYSATEESIVPASGIFDRPKGAGAAQTPENQARSVAEASYWNYVSNWAGLGVWSAYDHRNDSASYVYRDPFGVIDKDGTPLPAAGVFKGALRGVYDSAGEFRISLLQGSVYGGARINGLGGWNSGDPSANTIGGVFLPGGGTSSWTSDKLIVGVPMKLRLDFNLRTANTSDEPLIIRLTANSRAFDFRYKVYGVSAFQRLDISTGDIDHGFAQSSPLPAGANSVLIDLSGGLAPRLSHNGTALTFDDSVNGDLEFLAWQIVDLQLQVINNSNTAIDLIRLTDVGVAAEPIAFVPRAIP